MVKTKTVSFKRFSTKNRKNQKTESAKIEDSSFHNYSHSNQKSMTNLEHLPHIPKTTLVVIPIEQLTEIMQGIDLRFVQMHRCVFPLPQGVLADRKSVV